MAAFQTVSREPIRLGTIVMGFQNRVRETMPCSTPRRISRLAASKLCGTSQCAAPYELPRGINYFGEPSWAQTRDHPIEKCAMAARRAFPHAQNTVLGASERAVLHRAIVIRDKKRCQTKPPLEISEMRSLSFSFRPKGTSSPEFSKACNSLIASCFRRARQYRIPRL